MSENFLGKGVLVLRWGVLVFSFREGVVFYFVSLVYVVSGSFVVFFVEV